MSLTGAEFAVWCDGYRAGIVHGIDRGRELADAEAARRHHRAFTVMQAMARIPERDAEADRAAADRREARWSAVTASVMFVWPSEGRYALVKGYVRDWLRDNGIPALYSPSRRGWHVRMDRIADVIAQAERDGIRVRVKAVTG